MLKFAPLPSDRAKSVASQWTALLRRWPDRIGLDMPTDAREPAPAPPAGPKRALFVVNEYGEFFELLRVADFVSERLAVRPVFLFAREQYGEFDHHSSIARTRGYDSFMLSAESLAEMGGGAQKHAELARHGYLPESIWRPLPEMRRPLRLLLTVLLLPLAIVALFVQLGLVMIALFASGLLWLGRRLGLQRLAHTFFGRLPRLAMTLRTYRRWRRTARFIAEALHPDIVVMGQNYAGSFNEVLIRELPHVPSVIAPFAMATTKEIAESLYPRVDYWLPRGLVARAIRWLYPQWVNHYRGRDLLRLPIDHIIALDLVGLRNRHPWTPNAGTDLLCCQSQQIADYYAAAGIPAASLRVTGALWNDTVSENLAHRDADRSALLEILQARRSQALVRTFALEFGMPLPHFDLAARARQPLTAILQDMRAETEKGEQLLKSVREWENLPSDLAGALRQLDLSLDFLKAFRSTSGKPRKLVVISWPTNQYPRRACGFSTYDDYNDFLLDSMGRLAARDDVEVVVNLHPTMRRILEEPMFSSRNLHLLDLPLLQFIHCADVFVANVSSTIFWAVQAGIPTLNFDAYRYGYTEFAEAGCVTVTADAEFEQELDRLVSDPERYEEVKARIIARRDYWTRSGGAREAFAGAMTSLLETRGAQPRLVQLQPAA
jgi:hypothetical protein